MVQIPDKAAIFAEILRVLRSGGRFIASDWLRGGSAEYSPEMMEFFRLEGIAYNMATLEESAAALRTAGFVDVEIRDRHGWYLPLAQRELEAMEGALQPIIVGQIGAERAQHFIDNWRQLVVVLRRGELRPGHLKAVKPTLAARGAHTRTLNPGYSKPQTQNSAPSQAASSTSRMLGKRRVRARIDSRPSNLASVLPRHT